MGESIKRTARRDRSPPRMRKRAGFFRASCPPLEKLAGMTPRRRSFAQVVSALFVPACLLVLAGGCDRPSKPAVTVAHPAAKPAVVADLSYLKPQEIGAPIGRPPWIANVCPVDLDKDGLVDVLACEAQVNQVMWVRQTSRGVFEEKVIASDLRAPVHVEAVDIDADGDLDLLVASMAVVFPHNDRIGTVFILENDGRQNFTAHTILENTSRVVDIRAADLNGDGRLDLALAQFGYDQGEVTWLEQTGPWTFKRHVILELSGAINVCVADFDGDGKPDIAALLSQQWEEVYLFKNDGRGNFQARRLWGSTNEDYGSSGICVADLNRDGRPDIVYSNGDGFGPSATPGPRPWHGVQWLENKGEGNFRYERIGLLPGAYSPICVDLDGDGAMDVVASSAYADWNNKNRNVVSLMWFRNDGKMNFEPRALARSPKDLITLAAADFDGNGKQVLVTGGFYIYPPYDAMSRLTLWRR